MPLMPVTDSMFLLVESREHPMHVGGLQLFVPPEGADALDVRRLFEDEIAKDEVARLFQRHVLVELDFHRIELQIYGFNERAIAHAERSGFVREGLKRKAYFRHGAWQDAVVFSLLREDLDQEREIAPSSSSGLKPNGPSAA